MPSIKLTVSAVEEFLTRQVALRQGCSVSEVVRRGLKQVINSPASHVEMPEAVVDQLERRNGQGKKITAAYLSPPLAGAVQKLAAETGSSQSHVIRDLLRCELRRRGLLPTKQWGSADAIAERNHHDVADNAAP
jgi:Arc/MetJ-type ribon-helix-helix transcriptional regulator